MSNKYEVLRVMNNNVILAKNFKSSKEMVLMGKGIGFGKKKGLVCHMTSKDIEKSFVAGTESLKESYMRMLEEVNGQVVELCTEILLKAEREIGQLSDRSFIVLVDHISFAIEKLSKNIIIENPFSYEIQRLYPDEYSIGEFARMKIKEDLSIDITEAEVGFIALHLNAAKKHRAVAHTLKNTRIIKMLVELIESELDISIKDYPWLSNRLLAHLRGFMHYVDMNSFPEKHPLFKETVEECSQAYSIAKKLGLVVSKEKHVVVSEEELFYLTLHIDRLIRNA